MSAVTQEFVAIGCSRLTQALAWGRNGLIAYCAGRFVALYDSKAIRLVATLPGHEARVNAVAWIANTTADPQVRWKTPEQELLSASVDKTVILWALKDGKWSLAAKLEGHKGPVVGLATVTYADGSVLVATCSSDATVIVWKRPPPPATEFTKLQELSFGGKMVECIALTFVPGTQSAMLAAASVDNLIHIAVEKDDKFWKVASLSGHEDWVRCMSFVTLDSMDVLLASSSQDRRIRLWKISELKATSTDAVESNKIDISQLLAKLNASEDSTSTSLSQMTPIFKLNDKKYSILLESVMMGHEDWVSSVSWCPAIEVDGVRKQPLRLLSASIDKTMVVWTPDETYGLWVEEVRVGEVGGTQLGFFGGHFSPDGRSIIAHGYTGGFHLWSMKSDDSGEWEPQVVVSGHIDEVSDVDWDPLGQYFVTVSKDQTARVFSRWKETNLWHEIARPQVHGHDLNALAFQQGSSRHRYMSCSEEKVIRVFDAPSAFVDSLAAITGERLPEEQRERALTAILPPLGLSNKPVSDKKQTEETPDEKLLKEAHPSLVQEIVEQSVYYGWKEPLLLKAPPVEDELLQRTLWPEVEKLYGHGNEVICIASSHDGKLFASACSAKTAEQATIRIWSTSTWKTICEVTSHRLTVVQLEFSHDDSYLLAVSRDLGLSVIGRQGAEWKVIAKVAKAHSRIIWTCSWAPDDKFFATGSRDGTLRIWQFVREGESQGSCKVAQEFSLKVPVTAVAWAPVRSCYLLAVGLESGSIQFYTSPITQDGTINLTLQTTIPLEISHVSTVKRLRWAPLPTETKEANRLLLASCSEDYSVRLYSVDVAQLAKV